MRKLLMVDAGLVPYATAYGWQRRLHTLRVSGEIEDVVLLMEHLHVFTLGRRFESSHLLADRAAVQRGGVEIVEADRGGSITYHGPGQLVAYPIVDLRASGGVPDVISYLRLLERTIIGAAGRFRVQATAVEGLTGVWAEGRKLASIGVNVSRGVTKHGLALNVSTDLSFFGSMIPCGIPGCEMTSMQRILGVPVAIEEVAACLTHELARELDSRVVCATPEELDLSRPPARLVVGA